MSETRVAAPGVPSAAAQGGLPGVGGDPLGGLQPRRQEGQPATAEEGATEPPMRVQEFAGGRERANQPLAGEPPSKEGGCSTKEGAGRRRRSWGLTPGPWSRPATQLPAGDPGERPPPEPLAQKWGKRERDRCRGERLCWRNQGRKARGAKGPAAKPAWEWILLALCLWGPLQMGTALVLKGNHVEGEVFAFDALRCKYSRAHRPCPLLGAPVLRQRANQDG